MSLHTVDLSFSVIEMEHFPFVVSLPELQKLTLNEPQRLKIYCMETSVVFINQSIFAFDQRMFYNS